MGVFCDSAKKVIRDLGSVLQPDHDELVRFELNYFLKSGLNGDGSGIGASEYSQGVGDSESSGGYLSDVSLDCSHGPAQLLSVACRNHEVEVASYPPRRASPIFSEVTDSTLVAAAYFTEVEYPSNGEGEEGCLEERGRSLCGEMAGTVTAAPIRDRSEKKDKSLHKHGYEDPEERERRRADRRRRRVEKEEKKEREASEERERADRRQERQERHERRRQKVEKVQKPEVTIKEKTPKLTIEEYLRGFVCRFHYLSTYFEGNVLILVSTTGTNHDRCWVLGADPLGVDTILDLN